MNVPRAPLMTLEDALHQLLAYAQPLDAVQTLSTFEADGRVLAQDLVAELHVPPQDNSAMDGYAVRSAEAATGAWLPVSQRIPAGAAAQPLAALSVARIFTGAPLPPGADAVVMQEACEQDGNQVRVREAVQAGQWIRRAGEDVSHGTVVLQKGERLGPAGLGLAASLGLAKLVVARRPKVALFSTGDELVMPGDVPPAQLPAGAIYNSNRFFLRALLQRVGCEVSDLGIVPDQREATLQALAQAAAQHDLVLTSGGVSVGEEDHIKPAVQQLGALHMWQIGMKPGKPFAYGQIRRSPPNGAAGGAQAPAPAALGTPGAPCAHFMGLPGNPVSSLVTFALLVRPFLLKLQGATRLDCPVVQLPAHFDWPRADKRREFLRVRRNAQGGLDVFANQSSGVLTSAVWADGVVDNPAGQTITRGDRVRFIAWSELLS